MEIEKQGDQPPEKRQHEQGDDQIDPPGLAGAMELTMAYIAVAMWTTVGVVIDFPTAFGAGIGVFVLRFVDVMFIGGLGIGVIVLLVLIVLHRHPGILAG